MAPRTRGSRGSGARTSGSLRRCRPATPSRPSSCASPTTSRSPVATRPPRGGGARDPGAPQSRGGDDLHAGVALARRPGHRRGPAAPGELVRVRRADDRGVVQRALHDGGARVLQLHRARIRPTERWRSRRQSRPGSGGPGLSTSHVSSRTIESVASATGATGNRETEPVPPAAPMASQKRRSPSSRDGSPQSWPASGTISID